MRRISRCSLRTLSPWTLAVLLAVSPALARGQQTEVSDAGGGRKVETVYNAAHQVVETRTLDAAGRLQARTEYEYRTGFHVPQQTTTSYWPDGKTVRSQSRVEYDENANFVLQIDALFDATGKQTGGNKLTHDPMTGIYGCYKWSAESAGYRPEECPKPEEEAAGEEEHELTRAEVMEELAEARQALRSQEKVRRLAPQPPVQPPITASEREIGVVLPADLEPGERVSGSVVDGPGQYDGNPGLQVIRLKLPFESKGAAATLAGWTFVAANGEPQHADGPVTFTVPRGAAELTVALRQTGNPAQAVSSAISIQAGAARPAAGARRGFEGSPLCFAGGLCPVRGPFSGDSTRTLAAFGHQPAPIAAETSEIAYIVVPGGLPPGFTHLLVAEGGRAAVLPVDVAEFELTPLGRELEQGQTLVMHANILGADDLPDDAWRAGAFAPLASVEQARRLAPSFDPARQGPNGVILAVVQNVSADGVTMRGAKDKSWIFELTRESFARGEFKYNFVLDFARPGGYALRGTALPFLAPVKGREFGLASRVPVSPAAPKK
ncbi:MAG TPA: hypothetical protein VL523_13645 [Terriglobia bacterium]|nr:hypothetical protein [Terriglobia bacterium]